MTIWFTSDHHFGHANIIKYCNRPYKSVAEMNALMQAAWNYMVQPDDTVYYLGDFAMQPHMVTEILPKLNGTKLLIAGNHDKCHGGAPKWMEHHTAAGFKSIEKHLDLEIGGENVLLHHFPYRNELDPAQKHYGSRPVDRGRWLIHGHVHNRWKVSRKQINVSVEPWNIEPVSFESIARIIRQGPSEASERQSGYEE